MTEASSPTGVDEQIDAFRCGTVDGSLVVEHEGLMVVAADARDVTEPNVDLEHLAALAARAASHLAATGELTVTLVDPADMADLNSTHMGKLGPTDVLSFPLDADDTSPDDPLTNPTQDRPPRLLGDVVICPEVADSAASTHAGTVEDELALLVVHGVLHVLGYDHADPDETATMRALEMTILTNYHWRGPAPDQFRHDHADETSPDAIRDER